MHKTNVLVEALKFYADPNNWKSPSTGFNVQYDPEDSPIKKDHGVKARDALASIKDPKLVGKPKSKEN